MVNPRIIFRIAHVLCNLRNMLELSERIWTWNCMVESQLCCILSLKFPVLQNGDSGAVLSL